MAYRDLVKQAATVNGTGAFTLGAAVSGYQSMLGGGRVVGTLIDGYMYRHPSGEWEIGKGAIGANNTLTRTPLTSSNGGALVNFPAGTGEIMEVVTATAFNDFAKLSDGVEASALPLASAPTSADFLTIIQGGQEKRVAIDTLKTYFAASGTAPASTVSGVTISPATANVAGGATQQFTPTVAGTNSPSQAVTWGASAGTISSGGLFTAPAATGSAQAITITATSTQDGTKSGTATVTVAAAAATGASYNINVNGSFPPTKDASAETVYQQLRLVDVSMPFFTFGPTQPASAVSGWSNSNTVPPATITGAQNTNGGSSINGMTPTGFYNGNFLNNNKLWVPLGSGSTVWYYWVKPVDGAAQCMNPSGITVSNA